MSTWWDERGLEGNAPTPAQSTAPSSNQDGGGGEKKLSKKELNKLKKKQAKAAARGGGGAGGQQQQQQQSFESDPLFVSGKYGDMPLVQSQTCGTHTFTSLSDLDAALGDKDSMNVRLRGRIHNVRGKGKSAFVVLREQQSTAQAVFFVDAESKVVSKGMVKYATALSKESIVDIEGVAIRPASAIEGCSVQTVEVQGTGIRAVSRADPLPFQIADAVRREDDTTGAHVNQDTRLDNRFVELRTPTNQAIFRVQSAVGQLFRENLLGKGFVEIHSPKLMAGSSEGGSSVFELKYMGRPCCLAQSPQLCKQMAICADLGRVFEIGPVFRAEKSYTHRHLCEFVGMDFEMAIQEHYYEILDVIDDLFVYMFDGLKNRFAKELETVNGQYPFEPLQYLRPSLRLTFPEGIAMLKEAGYDDVDPLGDLSTETERVLGRLVKEKYGTDFYILHRYPLAARPFYTMPCHDDERYSNSFDVFIRGEEIISGAQRVHDPAMLTERAKACGLDVDTIASYIKSFSYGAPPHGGCGVGLERVVMLYLGLNNIRKTSMFPRDPNRLTPP